MKALRRFPRTVAGEPFRLDLPSRGYNRLSKAIGSLGLTPSQRRYNLSVSIAHRFVWFRVAKTGTRTLLRVLDEAGVALDAVHSMDTHYPEGAYRDFFAFTVVRNPWDRVVSCWRNKVVDANWWHLPPEELDRLRHFPSFVEHVTALDPLTCDVHLRAQSSVIDLNAVDYVGRFETLHTDLRAILERLDLDVDHLPHENASRSRESYREYYDLTTATRIGEFYRLDAQLFGYDF